MCWWLPNEADEHTKDKTDQPANDEPNRPQHDSHEGEQCANLAVAKKTRKEKRPGDQKWRAKKTNGEARSSADETNRFAALSDRRALLH